MGCIFLLFKCLCFFSNLWLRSIKKDSDFFFLSQVSHSLSLQRWCQERSAYLFHFYASMFHFRWWIKWRLCNVKKKKMSTYLHILIGTVRHLFKNFANQFKHVVAFYVSLFSFFITTWKKLCLWDKSLSIISLSRFWNSPKVKTWKTMEDDWDS